MINKAKAKESPLGKTNRIVEGTLIKGEIQSKDNSDELLTREETCQFLKIDSSTLWAWTNKQKVKAYGIASRRYYKKKELLECLTLLKK